MGLSTDLVRVSSDLVDSSEKHPLILVGMTESRVVS
jgi:hypothetical protein